MIVVTEVRSTIPIISEISAVSVEPKSQYVSYGISIYGCQKQVWRWILLPRLRVATQLRYEIGRNRRLVVYNSESKITVAKYQMRKGQTTKY